MLFLCVMGNYVGGWLLDQSAFMNSALMMSLLYINCKKEPDA